MIFPITGLLDGEQSEKWLLEHSHPEGLRCPKRGSTRHRVFRQTETSRLTVELPSTKSCQPIGASSYTNSE